MNDRDKFKNNLIGAKEYAKARINQGNEPPWAWFQYMKLEEVCESLLKGMAATQIKVVDDNYIEPIEFDLPI